jgi:hypothetical protein
MGLTYPKCFPAAVKAIFLYNYISIKIEMFGLGRSRHSPENKDRII